MVAQQHLTIDDRRRHLVRREKSFSKKIREVFRSFRKLFFSFRKFFEVFGRVPTRSDPFGPAGMHSDAFGRIRKRLGAFEIFHFF